MIAPDYSKRDYLLPSGCKDLVDTLTIKLASPPNVGELAALLGKKPVHLVASLFELGVFASVKQKLDFRTAHQVAQKYGYSVVRQTGELSNPN